MEKKKTLKRTNMGKVEPKERLFCLIGKNSFVALDVFNHTTTQFNNSYEKGVHLKLYCENGPMNQNLGWF